MNLDNGLGDLLRSDEVIDDKFNPGDVPQRTNLIGPPTSEKIAAVKVKDEDAYWVMSLKEGKFYVFKVDKTGVELTPVTGNDGFTISADLRGYLKTSPDGTKLVAANATFDSHLYDFDNATGIVSNEIKLDLLEEFEAKKKELLGL